VDPARFQRAFADTPTRRYADTFPPGALRVLRAIAPPAELNRLEPIFLESFSANFALSKFCNS
jgi:hypothetical protein